MWSVLESLKNKVVDRLFRLAIGTVADQASTATSFVNRLPLFELGFTHCPAIPFWANQSGDPDLKHILATMEKLKIREEQAAPAYQGLSTRYTIGNQTHKAYDWLYAATPKTVPLEKPEHFTLPWTNHQGMYSSAQSLVAPLAKTLTHADAAANSFWPTLASFGLPYNLLVISKPDADDAAKLEANLGDDWDALGLGAVQAAGRLYVIDMTIFKSLAPAKAPDGTVRFTPGTITFLEQNADPQSKALTPVGIQVASEGRGSRVYQPGDPGWLYALQAAKSGLTVWGIWLGHVYHWHIVTAAMQMAMYNELPDGHRLYPLLKPQSQSVIDFDFVLTQFMWQQIAPPTPVSGWVSLVKLFDDFADGRMFFDDDPRATLARQGITEADFTVSSPWDVYPIAGFLLQIWDVTARFVQAVVNDLYAGDHEVAQDTALQGWMKASRDPLRGNVRGLPERIETRATLIALLTSLLYRITAHGGGSLTPSVNPVLAFMADFPPCLQSATIPAPSERMTTLELLKYLPETHTMGGMTTFYYTFVYSKPYERLIPAGNIKSDPYFPRKACNDALFAYRSGIKAFVDEYVVAWNEALGQIRGAPGAPPSYAENQYGQWPRSVEI